MTQDYQYEKWKYLREVKDETTTYEQEIQPQELPRWSPERPQKEHATETDAWWVASVRQA